MLSRSMCSTECTSSLHKKSTFHQVNTMLATCKNVLFPGHNYLLTTGADDPTLMSARAPARVIIKVLGHQHQWLAAGSDLEIGHFLEVASIVVTWWIVGGFALCLLII